MSNMVTHDEIREYLHTVDTRRVIEIRFRLNDYRASFRNQNLQLLAVLDIIKEEIHTRFELIKIILMSVASELMAKLLSQ